MSMAARITPLDLASASASIERVNAASIARTQVFENFAEAEPHWRAVQCPSQLSTPFQDYRFLESWFRHVGSAKSFTPRIIVGFDQNDRVLAVLPLAVCRFMGLNIAQFMGDKHSTFNMALWRKDFASRANQCDVMQLIAALQSHDRTIDLLALYQQPRSWTNIQNPFSLLPRNESVNSCPRLHFDSVSDSKLLVSNSLRRRLKTKERKLQSLPGYQYIVAREPGEIKKLIDAFFVIKPLRMAEQKLPNVFAETGVEAFVRESCTILDGKKPLIELHALQTDHEVIALYAGMSDGRRFSMMFNTYTLSANARYSPGLILLRYIVDHYAKLGYKELDLGVGEADYKRMFCKENEAIFDSFVGLSAKGRLSVHLFRMGQALKRTLKHHPMMMKIVQTLRSSRSH